MEEKPVVEKENKSAEVTSSSDSKPVVAATPTKAAKKKWSNKQKGVVIGAASGAVAGAVVSKKHVKCAIVGGAVGGAVGLGAGAILDKKENKK